MVVVNPEGNFSPDHDDEALQRYAKFGAMYINPISKSRNEL